MSDDLYYVCDLRAEWRKKPCVTFWRPKSAGYAYPLPWSGKYTLDELAAEPAFFWERPYGKPKGAYLRFPVPCVTVEAFGAAPTPKLVDGDVGPVVWQTPQIVRALRAAMLPVPPYSTGRRDTVKKLHAQFWWALQYPVWWVAPDSRLFYAIRVKYARVVKAWLDAGRPVSRPLTPEADGE